MYLAKVWKYAVAYVLKISLPTHKQKSDEFDVRRLHKDLLLWFGPFLLKAFIHLNLNNLCVDTKNNNR